MPFSPISKGFWWVAILALWQAPTSATVALAWILRGKRVRGWNQLCRIAATHKRFYLVWASVAEPDIVEDWLGGKPASASLSMAVLLVGSASAGRAGLCESAASIRRALGDQVQIFSYPIAVDGTTEFSQPAGHSLYSAIHCLAEAGYDWILPVLAGDHVSTRLGAVLGSEQKCDASIIYWDEDWLEGGSRTKPWIKPDWDELLFLARDCLSGSAMFRSKLALAACSEMPEAAIDQSSIRRLALNAVRQSKELPRHIPLILTHRHRVADAPSAHQRYQDILSCWSKPMTCHVNDRASDFLIVAPPRPIAWPRVSILIPTKDRGELLEACTTSLGQLQYEGEVEVIIIDNGTTEPHASALLDTLEGTGFARVIRFPGPFNFSALNNFAAAHASGELLCLLNNDVEAIDGTWLQAMVRHAVYDRAGAIGAQLLYPDFTIQHAGVAIGVGNAAGHVEKSRCVTDNRFIGWHSVTREVSAVTAACLLIRRDLYLSVGGLDEKRYPVAFNDVDLCLRIKARGYRNILVAEARLIHHESVSRGDDWAPANHARFQSELANLQEQWATEGHRDPHFSQLFSRSSEQCVLAV